MFRKKCIHDTEAGKTFFVLKMEKALRKTDFGGSHTILFHWKYSTCWNHEPWATRGRQGYKKTNFQEELKIKIWLLQKKNKRYVLAIGSYISEKCRLGKKPELLEKQSHNDARTHPKIITVTYVTCNNINVNLESMQFLEVTLHHKKRNYVGTLAVDEGRIWCFGSLQND